MTIPPDQSEHLRKYGAIDHAPVRKPKPRDRLFTDAEVEEMRQFEALKLTGYLVGRESEPCAPIEITAACDLEKLA